MISVVIPTHNRSKLLQRAVKSVLSQTFKEIEVIIVSDASTDDTEVVISKLAKRNTKIKYISFNEPKGANAARNKGIEVAEYEYIAFLDDDDEWTPDKLEKQLKILETSPSTGLVYTGSEVIYVNEMKSYVNTPVYSGDLSLKILEKNIIGTTSTIMVRASVINEAGGFDPNLEALQDYELWIRICQKTEVNVIPEVCTKYYNYTNEKQISQNTDKYIEAIRQIKEKHSHLYKKLTGKEQRKVKSNFAMLLANKSMRNNSRKKAFLYSLLAFRKYPSVKSLTYILISGCKFTTILKLRKIVTF